MCVTTDCGREDFVCGLCSVHKYHNFCYPRFHQVHRHTYMLITIIASKK